MHNNACQPGKSKRIFTVESPQPMNTYQISRDSLLAEIVTALSNDERFVAAWLTGSLGRDDADALSDLDLNVVAATQYAETLCDRPQQVSAGTTAQRLALISRFGQPAVIHENHHNAPMGGTFTFVLYRDSALMVDWILIPESAAQRPAQSRLLFDKIGIPISAPPAPESNQQRNAALSERVAFFWMMSAVLAKYIARHDMVQVQYLLDMLYRVHHDIERLLAGEAEKYHRRSMLSGLRITREEQIAAVNELGEKMLALMPEIVALGGHIPESPMATITNLLNLK